MKKCNRQLRAIFGLARKRGLDKPDLEALAAETAGVSRLSRLSFKDANRLIVRLGGEPFPLVSPVADTTPRRTVNYRRQKAGVVALASPRHLEYLETLARNRGITPQGLDRLCMRMLRSRRPRTARGCNAVIEAIKSMMARDKASGGSDGSKIVS